MPGVSSAAPLARIQAPVFSVASASMKQTSLPPVRPARPLSRPQPRRPDAAGSGRWLRTCVREGLPSAPASGEAGRRLPSRPLRRPGPNAQPRPRSPRALWPGRPRLRLALRPGRRRQAARVGARLPASRLRSPPSGPLPLRLGARPSRPPPPRPPSPRAFLLPSLRRGRGRRLLLRAARRPALPLAPRPDPARPAARSPFVGSCGRGYRPPARPPVRPPPPGRPLGRAPCALGPRDPAPAPAPPRRGPTVAGPPLGAA